MNESSLLLAALGVGAVTGSVVNIVVANAGDTLYQTTKNLMVLYLEVEGFFNDAFKEAEKEYAQKSGKSETTVQKECQHVGNEMNEAVEAITIAAEVTTMAV